MEERRQVLYVEDEINIGEYFTILRPYMWRVIGLSLVVGLVTLFLMFLKPNLFKATAVITPAAGEEKQNPSFGALASFGIPIEGPTKVVDLEALFKSNDLTVRVFQKYNLWLIVMPENFDPKTGKIQPNLLDHLFGRGEGPEVPSDWDAIRSAQRGLDVTVNRKNGILTVSFDSPSPKGSADIVRHYLDEAKSRLQEEAFERAVKNKKFIEEQINKTVDALTRDRLYSLYGQEVEREMLARNREQFGFRIIDSARIPDRKSGPKRAIISVVVTAVSFPAWCLFYFIRGRTFARKD